MNEVYPVILDFHSFKDAAEAALQVVGTLHKIDFFVGFQVKQSMIPSLSLAFVALLCICERWLKVPEKTVALFLIFNYSILLLSVYCKD